MPDEKERKIIRLEKQIEAMKMCGNCENSHISGDGYLICSLPTKYITVDQTFICKEWQLEEKI